jgi:hypothetical protein
MTHRHEPAEKVQETVKLLYGMRTLEGSGFVFDGTWHQSYVVNYKRLEDCPAHEEFTPVNELPGKIGTTSAGEVLENVRSELGPAAVIEFNSALFEPLTCTRCDETEPLLTSLSGVSEAQARCPTCNEHRVGNMYHRIGDSSALLDRTLGELGVPPWEVLTGRAGMERKFYEFSGDREAVLGTLR